LAIVPNTNYTLKVWVNLTGDENATNDEKEVNFLNMGDISAPWQDDVELHSGTTSSNIGNCWVSSPSNNSDDFRWNIVSNGGQTPSDNTGPNFPNSGSNYFYTEASSPATTGAIAELITPEVTISGLNTPLLSFYYHMYGADMGSLHVDIFNAGTWHNDEVVISGQQQTSGSDLWLEQTLILSAFTGEIKVRFRGIRGADYTGDIALDDISIVEAPSCPKPNAFVATSVSFNSVDLTWSPGNTETNWQLEYGVDGFAQGTGTLLQVTTNSHTVLGLNSNTEYDVYLRANCGAAPGDDDSLWVGPLSFTTLFDYCNGDHFYDSGGASGNYSNSENIITSIAPSAGYDLVSVQFNSFETESGYDFLRIYDGPDTASTLLGVFDGAASLGTFTSTHATGSLTFHFTSDGSVTRSGWDATVTCVATPNITVNPLSMSETLQQEATQIQLLNISNTGNIELTYSLAVSGAPWLSFNPVSGNLASNTSIDIDVQFNATGLDLGTYNTNIIVTSNDPNTPEISIPVSLIVETGVGTEEYMIDDLKYYPNPANEMLTISAAEILESITIYSMLGQELVSKEIFDGYTAEIDMTNLSPGTYLIKVFANSKINTLRIIKK